MAFNLPPGPLHDGECLSCLKLSDQVEAIRKERDDWESRCRDKWDANTLLRRELEKLQENYSRESDLAYRLSRELDEAKKTIARLQHEKDDAVFRNKILRERPDLPIERIRAYDTIMETVKKSEQHITILRDALMKIACANEPSDRDGMIDVAVEALLKTNKGDSNEL